jgi:ABC-type spermidine/putrescine transport system permease subunit II
MKHDGKLFRKVRRSAITSSLCVPFLDLSLSLSLLTLSAYLLRWIGSRGKTGFANVIGGKTFVPRSCASHSTCVVQFHGVVVPGTNYNYAEWL